MVICHLWYVCMYLTQLVSLPAAVRKAHRTRSKLCSLHGEIRLHFGGCRPPKLLMLGSGRTKKKACLVGYWCDQTPPCTKRVRKRRPMICICRTRRRHAGSEGCRKTTAASHTYTHTHTSQFRNKESNSEISSRPIRGVSASVCVPALLRVAWYTQQ